MGYLIHSRCRISVVKAQTMLMGVIFANQKPTPKRKRKKVTGTAPKGSPFLCRAQPEAIGERPRVSQICRCSPLHLKQFKPLKLNLHGALRTPFLSTMTPPPNRKENQLVCVIL